MKQNVEAKHFNLKLKDSSGLRQRTTYNIEATHSVHACRFPVSSWQQAHSGLDIHKTQEFG
jgi:hypothetical protein